MPSRTGLNIIKGGIGRRRKRRRRGVYYRNR